MLGIGKKLNSMLKIGYIVVFCTAVIFLVFIPCKLMPADLHPIITKEKVAIIADIHAASQDMRKMGNTKNIVYPNMYETVFPNTLRELKDAGFSLIVSLGDNTNDSSKVHARRLKAISDEQQMQVLWLEGNHERSGSEVMSILGIQEKYYYVDRNDWRIVVLDTTDQLSEKDSTIRDTVGGIGRDQLNWLENALDTDKFVLIAMHHPIWEREDINAICPEYTPLENIFEKHRNVRYVFSGHWHTESWSKKYKNVEYYQIPAFTLDGNIGYYKTMELESYMYWP
jgi:3',5'-cyclic AMP phosphodiesterase CpdA